MKGIKIHADFAAINVNFWIAPDKANLNKLNITPNNLPKEKRIVLLNQSK